MGEPAPEWDGPLGDHVKNDFAATNERLRRRAPAAARADRARRVRRGDRRPGWPSWTALSEDGVGRRRLEPGGRGAARRVHGGAGLRQLGARAGRPPRPRPSGREREPRPRPSRSDRVQGAMPFVVGKKAGCADGTAVRFEVAGPGQRRARLHDRRRGRTGPPGRRRGGADGDPVAVEHRLRAPRLRPGHGGTGGGRRRRRTCEGDAVVGRVRARRHELHVLSAPHRRPCGRAPRPRGGR